MDEEYPKAAKLLDIVRCSASYNTVSQLMDGYNAFMKHIESGATSMTLARVKNGFIDSDDGGYRDIKVNVVYQSILDPKLKIICEVQFILNQYLYEKKRVHKLYSIARERTYFDMVVREEDDAEGDPKLKAMKFEPVLNVRDDVELNEGQHFFKCSIESDLELLGMNGGMIQKDPDKFFCVNMATNKLIFNHPAAGRYTHHWIIINDQKYLSLQTSKNTINLFRVSDDLQFTEDETMKITLNDDDVINFCEYDQSFEHIFYVRNFSILEKRAVKNLGTVSMSIELENQIGNSMSKLLSLSNDGKYCVVGAAGNTRTGGGAHSNFFYIISLETQEQFKLTSQNLTNTYAPCFINGDSEYVAVGGKAREGVEIWSVGDKEMVQHVEDNREDSAFVSCTCSANGILAVGFASNYGRTPLHLYDVSSWKQIYDTDFEMIPRSLFLTVDNKHLAAGGNWGNGEKCVVIKIR